jgi:hypothetical protein
MQENPTMTRIDRAFCTTAWEEHFIHPIIQPLSSSIFYHCPLLLAPVISPATKPIFRFESYWVERLEFQECVMEAWNKPVPINQNHLAAFHIKLSRVTKSLKSWPKNLVSQGKLVMTICREVVDQLDLAQERRRLSVGERNVVKDLKMRLLGMTAIEKIRARQRSKLTWLRYGDANTNFFHLMPNARKKKKFIHSLESEGRVVLSQEAKQEAIYKHFLQHSGTYVPRQCTLNFFELG